MTDPEQRIKAYNDQFKPPKVEVDVETESRLEAESRQHSEQRRHARDALWEKKVEVKKLSTFIANKLVIMDQAPNIQLYGHARPIAALLAKNRHITNRKYRWSRPLFPGWVLHETPARSYTEQTDPTGDYYIPPIRFVNDPGSGICLLEDGDLAEYTHHSPKGVLKRVIELDSGDLSASALPNIDTSRLGYSDRMADAAGVVLPDEIFSGMIGADHAEAARKLMRLDRDLLVFARKRGVE